MLAFTCFQDAVALVQDITDAEAASRKLIQEAYARGSTDNITCVVVRFDWSPVSSSDLSSSSDLRTHEQAHQDPKLSQ